MTYVELAIASGLTPREMEHNIRNHVPLDEVGRAYGFDLLTMRLLATRWGLDHLTGRSKHGVHIVRERKR